MRREGGRRDGGRVVVVDVCGILRGSCGVVAMHDTLVEALDE